MKLIIQNNALNTVHVALQKIAKTVTIVTDVNMQSKANELATQLKKHKFTCHVLVLPAGEKSKSFSFVEKIITSMVKLKMKRDSALIAFGGGVVGDIAGFAASIYMRGIPFINIPTTVLAMADSCIGGKTGIDLPEGKNLVGTFYDPELIVMDPTLLKSLPDSEFKSGMAEIIKHAIIRDKTFFNFLEKNVIKILNRNTAILLQILKKSAAIKTAIVKKDKNESPSFVLTPQGKTSSRMLVNYGHTVGHALEKASNFTVRHGNAVAIGMIAENRLAIERKILKERDALRIEKLIKAFGLPTRIPSQYSESSIKQHMLKDKKHIGKSIYFALPKGIGNATLVAYDYV